MQYKEGTLHARISMQNSIHYLLYHILGQQWPTLAKLGLQRAKSACVEYDPNSVLETTQQQSMHQAQKKYVPCSSGSYQLCI